MQFYDFKVVSTSMFIKCSIRATLINQCVLSLFNIVSTECYIVSVNSGNHGDCPLISLGRELPQEI